MVYIDYFHNSNNFRISQAHISFAGLILIYLKFRINKHQLQDRMSKQGR